MNPPEQGLFFIQRTTAQPIEFPFPDQGKLGFESYPLIGVRKQIHLVFRIIGQLGQQSGGFLSEFAIRRLRIIYLDDPALIISVPSPTPIREVKRSVRAKVDTGRTAGRGQAFGLLELKGSAVGLQPQRLQSRARRVTKDKGVAPLLVQGGTRFKSEPARTAVQVGERRSDVGGLSGKMRNEIFFGQPRTVSSLKLPVPPPSVIGAFDVKNQSLFLAPHVAVIIRGKPVSEVIKGDFHSVATTRGEDFKIRSIGFGSDHRAMIGIRKGLSILLHVQAAVAQRPVQTAIGTNTQAVQIMSPLTDLNRKAGDQRFTFGLFVQFPQGRKAGKPDFAFPGEDPTSNAIHFILKRI